MDGRPETMASHYSNREQFNPLAETAIDRHHPSPILHLLLEDVRVVACCLIQSMQTTWPALDDVHAVHMWAAFSIHQIGRDLNWIIESMLCVVGGGGLRST
jgi:hypothetical protein